MSKLFWLQPDNTIIEFALKAEQNLIGRGGRSDIRIKHPGISAEHALVLSRDGIATLEDLKSTNGTRVNGRRIDKHTLRHGDQIEIGRERLMYFAQLDTASRFAQPVPEAPFAEPAALGEVVRTEDAAMPKPPANPTNTPSAPRSERSFLAPSEGAPAPAIATNQPPGNSVTEAKSDANKTSATTSASVPVASIAVLSGPAAGKRYELDKPLTTLGKEGKQVIEIERLASHQWQLRLRSGVTPPYINGDAAFEPRMLAHADIIELTGIRLRFDVGVAG